MNSFVDECRLEWKRLGVPDSLAEEMASDLEADLEDANAEGVPAPEVVGDGDPRRLARDWAVARGLVRDEPSTPRRTRRYRLLVSIAVLLLAGGGTALGLGLAGTLNSPPRPPKTVPLPLVTGMKETQAARVLRASGLLPHVILVKSQRAGYVVAQSPAAGARLGRGSVVRLRVGRGG